MTDKNKKDRNPFNPVTRMQQAPSVEPAPVPVEEAPEWKEVVATEYMRVLSAPNSKGEELVVLTRGRRYMVELSGKSWLKIKHPALGNRIGYVSATILDSQPAGK